MASQLIQQVRVLDPVTQTDRVADVLIVAGRVSAIAAAIADYPAETQIYPGQGLILAPGLVDLYSHSGEPGLEACETLVSLMQAALAGGFTRITILPDTQPALDTPASIAWLTETATAYRRSRLAMAAGDAASPTPFLGCWSALTVGVQGQQMTELAELAHTGSVGFADGQPITNSALVRHLLEYLQPIAKPVALWACDPQLAGNGVMREGQESLRLGLPGIPAIAETAALATLLEYVAAIGTPVHLMRISTARSVELIQAAKSRGVPVTASTTWMHLLGNSLDIASYNPNLRLAPPLGNPSDQAALIHGLQTGVLDAIAIDHNPQSYEDKTVAFAEAPAGAIGLELALPLLWQRFVEPGVWSALDLWRYLSQQPALCLQQQPPTIALNQLSECILFDPTRDWRVETRSLKSLSSNTPWLGHLLRGRVIQAWCNPEPAADSQADADS